MRPMLILLVIAALLLLSVVALYEYQISPSVAFVGGVGDELHIDDYGVTLLAARRVPALGEGPARVEARGEYVVLTVRIANDARRVEYSFDPDSLRLQDGEGREYAVAPEAQAVLRAATSRAITGPCAGPLPPGGRCTTEVAFDVPLDARALQLRYCFADGLLGALDVVLFGKQRLKVP